MKKARSALIGIILIACIGLGAYLVVGRQPPEPLEPGPQTTAEHPTKPPVKAKIYQIGFKGNEASLQPVEIEVPGDQDPAEGALRRLFEQVDEDGLVNPIPKGTRLLSLEVKNGLATVNLSKEFSDNFSGGSEEEALTIGAILRTLSQFPEIKKAQFELAGEPLDTLGHLDFGGPQDVNWVGTELG